MMRLSDFYDSSLISRVTTGIDYPVWIIWDEDLLPVVGVSNIHNHYGYHNDIFFISIENNKIINTPKIPQSDLEQIQDWVIKNKDNLLLYNRGQCCISKIIRQNRYATIRKDLLDENVKRTYWR